MQTLGCSLELFFLFYLRRQFLYKTTVSSNTTIAAYWTIHWQWEQISVELLQLHVVFQEHMLVFYMNFQSELFTWNSPSSLKYHKFKIKICFIHDRWIRRMLQCGFLWHICERKSLQMNFIMQVIPMIV